MISRKKPLRLPRGVPKLLVNVFPRPMLHRFAPTARMAILLLLGLLDSLLLDGERSRARHQA
jgi:hypothetical protein